MLYDCRACARSQMPRIRYAARQRENLRPEVPSSYTDGCSGPPYLRYHLVEESVTEEETEVINRKLYNSKSNSQTLEERK